MIMKMSNKTRRKYKTSKFIGGENTQRRGNN